MDNITILLLSVVSQWVVMCFPDFKGILTYGVNSCVPCLRLHQRDVSSDVFGGVNVNYHCLTLPGSQYKLVCLIFRQYF